MPARLSYGHSEEVTRGPYGWSSPGTRSQYGPLPVTISNNTDQIVTVDWEHSAFVDSTGSSYRVRVYPQGTDANVLDRGPQAIDKPPVPVLAPAAHIVAFVLPERGSLQPPMFFFPPLDRDDAPLKLVVSITGTPLRHVECTIRGRLEGTETTRSAAPPWPQPGEECVPHLGCAEGLSCVAGACADPSKPPPVRVKRGQAQICRTDEDCAEGLRCASDTTRCVAR